MDFVTFFAGRFLPRTPKNSLLAGQFNDVPVVIGRYSSENSDPTSLINKTLLQVTKKEMVLKVKPNIWPSTNKFGSATFLMS